MKLTRETLHLLQDRVQSIRGENGKSLVLAGPIKMPVNLDGQVVFFRWYCWLALEEFPESLEELFDRLPDLNLAEKQQSSVLVYGDFEESDEAVIRLHSICHTGDIFGSKRCDCGYQLRQSMRIIVEHGAGALFYIANQEGRGIGLFSKALTYLLQEQGFDTIDANLLLGFPEDVRNYEEAIVVLNALRQKPTTLLTNNPSKIGALLKTGMHNFKHSNLWGDITIYNQRYIKTKVKRSGHLMVQGIQEEELTCPEKV